MKRQICFVLALSGMSFLTVGPVAAQDQSAVVSGNMKGYYSRIPWTDGTADEALARSAAGTTIPMFTYTMAATKDGGSYKLSMAGTSPFAATLGASNIGVDIVMLQFTIAGQVFDPYLPNACLNLNQPYARFANSPLFSKTAWTFNGVNVGTTQYVDAFRRGEFWSTIVHKNAAAYTNTLGPKVYLPEIAVNPGSAGIVYGTGCTKVGIVSQSWLENYLRGTLIPSLTASGAINPTRLTIFLTWNVVSSSTNPPTVSACCALGYHTATGTAPQTYTVIDFDTTKQFASTSDISIGSHELAEWMDDPLANNYVPYWGSVGQVSGCPNPALLEVGDPLTGTLLPALTGNYHVQELAYFSWFFNAKGYASMGTGGKFSNNGKFTGPSQPCPPGGTY
ncbi:MAG: hypothetical protein U0Q18_24995 [Bryobacteraceae bacterium]